LLIAADVEGVDLPAIGGILFIVGIVGLIVSVVQNAIPQSRSRRERYVSRDGNHIIEDDFATRLH
jgi:hypothetical protein